MGASSDETVSAVLDAAQRILAARGEASSDSLRQSFSQGGLTISRTELGELEITVQGHVVLHVQLGRRDEPVHFVSGNWIKELRCMDESFQKKGRKS